MNTSELWITREEIRLMLDGGLTWTEVAARVQAGAIKDEFKEETSALSRPMPETFIPDYSEPGGGGAGLSGLPVLALIGGTGVLTLFLWLYLVIR